MERKNRTILVIGATGSQGNWAARYCLCHGYDVRGLSRDVQKPGALMLSELGVEMVPADLNDPPSIERAMRGCYGVFCVLTPYEEGPEAEVRQGRTVADAARQGGIRHFVYSSVGGADRQTGIAFFESKWQVEQYLRAQKLPVTMIRPVWFMENFLWPQSRQGIERGQLRLAVRPERLLQMIAVEDIGRVAATCFDNRDRWLGKAIELAGDELTLPRAAELLSRTVAHEVRYVRQPMDELRQAEPAFAAMFEWFNEHGYEANIPELEREFGPMIRFEQWLKRVWQRQAAEVHSPA